MNAARVSVVVPTMHEAVALPRLLARLRQLQPYEVIVADGGSGDDTVAIARAAGARVVLSSPGRGQQLRAGCSAAQGEVLWMLHADTLPPRDAWRYMRPVVGRGHAGAFRLRVAHPAFAYRVVEWGAWLRTAATRIPYGDQGLFLPRTLYDAVGGFPEWPIFEDVGLAQRLAARGATIELLPAAVVASARRWQRDGVVLRTWRNWMLAMQYHALGVDPRVLAQLYPPPPPPPPRT